MSVRIKCNECSKPLKVSIAHANKRVKCPGCGASLLIPDEETIKAMEAKQAARAGSPPAPAPPPPPADDFLSRDLGPGGFGDHGPDAGGFVAPDNPFASPLADDGSTQVEETVEEATRRRLLTHEASVRSMGTLFMIGAVLVGALGAVGVLIGVLAMFAGDPEAALGGGIIVVVCGFILAMAAFQGWVAIGLWKLNPVVRIPAIVLSAIGLLGAPIGTLINGYFLYLLCSKKGEEVLSERYRSVVAATPHIRYKTSIIVWILIGLLVMMFLLALIGVIAGQ